MTTTATPANQSVTTHTISLASLASDASLVAGREGTAIDNGTEDAIDAVLGGFITTGTSPTASKQIQVWVCGSYDGTSYAGGATGSDANLTPQASATSLLKLAAVIPTNGTSNQKYTFCVGSIAALFGGVMPRKWSVFIVHNTGVALHATGSNHEIKHTPVKYESA